jgi:Ca-activated chloride channel family protein
VFCDRPLQVIAKCPVDFRGSVTVNGILNGRKVSYSYLTDRESNGSIPALAKLFGRARINDLMCDWIHAETPERRALFREDIVRVALDHQLVSKFTSRVAVEEKVEKQPDGTLLTVNVPAALPKGWNPAAFLPTATRDVFLALMAAAAIVAAVLLALIRRRLSRVPQDV